MRTETDRRGVERRQRTQQLGFVLTCADIVLGSTRVHRITVDTLAETGGLEERTETKVSVESSESRQRRSDEKSERDEPLRS